MRHIVHLIGSLRLGGAEKVVSVLAQAFDKDQCEVYICAFTTGELEEECRCRGAKVIIMPFQWRHAVRWLFCFVKELKALHIDVLHTHLFTADFLGRIGGRMAGVPVVVSTIHAPSTWKRSRGLKDRLKLFADRLTANYFTDCLFSISKQVSDYQVRYGGIKPSKIKEISNPIVISRYRRNEIERDVIRASIGLKDNHKVITNVASLKPVKGQKYLIQALRDIVRNHPDVCLLLVGDGQDRDVLAKMASTLGVSENVHFLGNRIDVPAILSASDIFVMPSLSEGISMAILEAMAAELPVVATAVGGNPDIILDNVTGLLVAPANASYLAKALERMLNDHNFARSLGIQAKQFVKEHHDAEMIAHQLAITYRSIYHKKRCSMFGD
jgi:glycosyltransferase involved in cell wall biosynthesis